tara:strand:- start:352 stop:519 length:168 start_codon:yes stop_codon:yes gene_type:complete
MKEKRQSSKLRAFISSLMKGKSEEEITSAEQSFRAYIQLVQDIQRRRASEKKQED